MTQRDALIVGPELFINLRKGPSRALRLPQIVSNSAKGALAPVDNSAYPLLGDRLARTLALISDDQAQTFGQSGALGSTNTQLQRHERR